MCHQSREVNKIAAFRRGPVLVLLAYRHKDREPAKKEKRSGISVCPDLPRLRCVSRPSSPPLLVAVQKIGGGTICDQTSLDAEHTMSSAHQTSAGMVELCEYQSVPTKIAENALFYNPHS